MTRLKYLVIGLLLALAVPVYGQSTSLWKLVGTKVRPVTNSWRVDAPGGFSGRTLTVSGLKNCDTLDTNGNGVVSCGTDASGGGGTTVNTGAVLAAADGRFVNQGGDTMTGALTVNISGGNRNTRGINVVNTISGAVVHAEKTLTSSGTFVWEGSASGASLWVSNIDGAGLSDCDDGTTGKLLWDATSKRFSCGTDTDTDTNTTYTAGKGLTLTATSFAVNANLTGSTLNFLLISGSTLHGEKTLSSSGTLVWEGAASGATMVISGQFTAPGLTSDCDGATQKVVWDVTTKRWACGTDVDTDTNTTYTAGQGLALDATAFSVKASLTGSSLWFTAISGSTLKATTSIASSGSLTWEGPGSGASLYIGGTLEGAGLVSCSNGTTSKLLWDSTGKRFSCGTDTDTNTTYTAGQGLGLTGTAFRLADSFSGTTLKITGTASGKIIHAEQQLRSSGTLVVEGATTLANTASCTMIQTNAQGALSCQNSYAGQNTIITLGTVTTGTWDATTVAVTAGGTGFESCTDGGMVTGNGTAALTCNDILGADEIYVGDGTTEPTARTLPSCSAAGDTLNYNSTTDTFSCGSDGDTTYTAGQGLTLTSTSFKVNAALTGSSLRFTTISGSTLKATTSIASSGSLTWEGPGSGASLYIGGTFDGAGLSDCDADGQALSWDSTSKRFVCGDDDGGGGGISQADGDARYVQRQGDTMTGSLTMDGGSLIFADNAAADDREIRVDDQAAADADGNALEIIGAAANGEGNGGSISITAGGAATEGNGGSLQLTAGPGAGAGSQGFVSFATAGSDFFFIGAGGFLGTNAPGFSNDNPGVFGFLDFSGLSENRTFTMPDSNGVIALVGGSDVRYVNVEGDTMTGALRIETSGIGLNVTGTASGKILHAESELRSSGSLVVEGATVLNGTTTLGDNTADTVTVTGRVGSALIPSASTFDQGTTLLRWDDIYMDSTLFMGADGDDGSFTYVQGSNAFTLDATSNANTDLAIGEGRVGVNAIANDAALEVVGTASGTRVYAEKTLASSGSLVWEGAASGATMVVSGAFTGPGQTGDCDTAGTSKVLWDLTTKRFSCGTDANTTYTAGQGLTLTSTALSLTPNHSGSIIRATTTLSSSGTLNATGRTFLQDVVNVSAGITSTGAIQLLMPAPGSAGQRDSNFIMMRGSAFDTSAHFGDWRMVVDVQGNNGDTRMLFQSRIDSAAYGTEFVVDDNGEMSATNNISIPTGSAFRMNDTDSSWKMGRNTGSYTKTLVSSNSIDAVGATGANEGFTVGGNGGDSSFEILTGNDQAYFRGNVGIGTTRSIAKLTVVGIMSGSNLTVSNLRSCDTIDTSAAGVTTCGTDASDIRLKENVEPLEDGALDFLNSVRTVTFDWNDTMLKLNPDTSDDGRQMGFIAQDFVNTYPELVTLREDGFYRLDYEKTVPLLTKAIQELDAKVKRLESKQANPGRDFTAYLALGLAVVAIGSRFIPRRK